MLQEKIHLEPARPVTANPLELAVIIPTFNEATSVSPLLARLAVALAGIHWEAIFVDDNSPDGTADLVRSLGRTDLRVRVIQRIGRRGRSTAVIEGMLATSAPILAVIDGPMQHDERILPQLYDAVRTGRCDVAVGSRLCEGGSVASAAGDGGFVPQLVGRLGQLVVKTSVSDPMSGLFCVARAPLMAALPSMSGDGFKVLLDILASSPQPLRVAEIVHEFRSGERAATDAMLGVEYIMLLADKLVGWLIPLRLLSFIAVGGTGVFVHLAVLGTALYVGAQFLLAQFAAVMVAMTFNFFLHNVVTYRDRRLHGWQILTGLLSFYAVCMVGALANIGIGTWFSAYDDRWWLAGMAGVVVGAVWNFAATSFVTWRK